MSNLLEVFRRLVPTYPLRVGTVLAADTTSVVVEESGGAQTRIVGAASVGQKVYFRNGALVGAAPDLPLEVIEE